MLTTVFKRKREKREGQRETEIEGERERKREYIEAGREKKKVGRREGGKLRTLGHW